MLLRGKLIAETPIYRGNARKTLFTRDGDGAQRLVSLAGEISGTAQALMDAFIGQSRDGRNIGLLNRAWLRLYGSPLPDGLITRVDCRLQDAVYPQDHFFDLRMGLKLDEDRWAAEANANYKMETVFRNAAFDFTMAVNDAALERGDNAARLHYLLQELREGRFWFGAGKSKGLGRVRLEADWPGAAPAAPALRPDANHLKIVFRFNADNPVLVGWNWGKVDPEVPAFAAIEGRLLVAAMRDIPDPVRQRLEMVIGGPILNPEDWKRKLAEYLPRTVALWLQERSSGETEVWILREKALAKLAKGKYPLSQKVIDTAKFLCDRPFPSETAAEVELKERVGNQAKRIVEIMEHSQQASQQLNHEAWLEAAESLGLDAGLEAELSAQLADETALTKTLAEACRSVLPRLYQQIDQQVSLLQSDAWVDAEIASREVHLRIKIMLLEGKITEAQWGNRNQAPEGISPAGWRTFLEEHSRVRYSHIVAPVNLRKSIANDRNFIAFLKSYRSKTRQELAQPHHVDFRAGGPFNREISRKYGKPYDTMFMRMLTWQPSAQQEGAWEIYIPGSTVKGAFRKRASQVLKTLWGESPRVTEVIDYLFGRQGQRGAVYFSDAYLADPTQPEKTWCSMDGVRMDPATARPVESAKHDYLFAYGDQLNFQLQLELQDLTERELPALAVLLHLLEDFKQGDVVLGGEKTAGFGWVKARVSEITWLTANPASPLTVKLFPDQPLPREGLWHRLTLTGAAAADGLKWSAPLAATMKAAVRPPRAQAGFVSHRSFGGYSGTLAVEAETLTPLHVRESGEPTHKVTLADGNVNGWDCFSFSPAEAALRGDARLYALPSRSLKGMLRHVYAIASDSKTTSPDISRLNPVDGLFGWVGSGPNQALMGRLAFSFAPFEGTPELSWFKVPYPYGGWICENGVWRRSTTKGVPMFQIAKTWRLFNHAPVAPIVQRLDAFKPDVVQASYTRAILPGATARFGIRFWNLEREELQRLIWCVGLEDGLAHKLGHHRYVGFGSLRLRLLPGSSLVDVQGRYAGGADWRTPLKVEEWLEPKVVAYRAELQKALDARVL
ncbi:MAG: RAMP superfamily CRISPR-associated protein [Chloroflexi bacterium]|nr:RAMP superfamily CRISPR-associated protein [Chloroflexota bacterium]